MGQVSAVHLDRCLSKVGVDPHDLVAEGGSLLADVPCYLVGSLAQGYGNRGSDVDIDVFEAELDDSMPPFIFFVKSILVDIQRHPAGVVPRLIASLDEATLDTELGPMGKAPSMTAKQRRALTRWSNSVPLRDDMGPLVDDVGQKVVAAHQLRSAFDDMWLSWVLAELATEADMQSDYLWRRCRRRLLNVLCTAAGSPPIGEKWLAARCQRVRLDERVKNSVGKVADGHAMTRFLTGIGIAAPDPRSVVTCVPDKSAPTAHVGNLRLTLSRHDQALHAADLVEGACSAALKAGRLMDLMIQLRLGLVTLSVDDELIGEVVEK